MVKKRSKKAVQQKSRGIGTVVTTVVTIATFLANAVKLALYFFDPKERARKRKEKEYKKSQKAKKKAKKYIDKCDEKHLNELLKETAERRKKKSTMKGKKS